MSRAIFGTALLGLVVLLAIITSEAVDGAVPESGLTQAAPGSQTLAFLSVKEKATCEINVERCFSSSQYPAADPCQVCNDRCIALEKSKCSPATLVSCKRSCQSKCVWAYETKSFISSYKSLCADEMSHKVMVTEKLQAAEQGRKEMKAKKEKDTKAAQEDLAKCANKEASHKTLAAAQTMKLDHDLEVAQKNEAKLSTKYAFFGKKNHQAADEAETKLFTKEQATKEGGFKKVSEVKNKSEAKVKALKEQLYKKKKINSATQETIYKTWNLKVQAEKRAKTAASTKLPVSLPPAPPPTPATEETRTYVVEKEPAQVAEPTSECKCKFPYNYGGQPQYGCLKQGDTPAFCFDGAGASHPCTLACAAVYKVAAARKQPPAPVPMPAPAPPVVSTVDPSPAPVQVPPAVNTHELKVKSEESNVKKLQEALSKKHVTKADTTECTAKVEVAQKSLESKSKLEGVSKREVIVKREAASKAENLAKEKKVKEAYAKEEANKEEVRHKNTILQLQKESKSKVAVFKTRESALKTATMENKKKNPFKGLSTYCESLQKLKIKFMEIKETGAKKIKESSEKNQAQAVTMRTTDERSRKHLKDVNCYQTKEVCGKIHGTSELKEKEAAKFASERKSKLQAKCALSLKYEKAEAAKLKFAICQAAHKDVEKTLATIEHRESSLITQTIQAGWSKSATTVKYQKYVPNLGKKVKTVTVAIKPTNPVVVEEPGVVPVAPVTTTTFEPMMKQPIVEPTQPVIQTTGPTEAPVVVQPFVQPTAKEN